MNRIVAVLFVIAAFMLASCEPERVVIVSGDAPAQAAATGDTSGAVIDNMFMFDHIDGHGGETQMPAYVLFEHEQLTAVKYQVAYVACTCRAPNMNYWTVAYLEISKDDGSVAFISYGNDSGGTYTPGLYGDSQYSWDDTPVWALFEQYIADNLMGASQDAINAIEPMHGNVDAYTGATVTPNNAVRMLQGLFRYHNERYS